MEERCFLRLLFIHFVLTSVQENRTAVHLASKQLPLNKILILSPDNED